VKWQTTVMPFGKHKGLTFEEVAKKDAKYIHWMYSTFDAGPLKNTAAEALNHIMGVRKVVSEKPEDIFVKIKLLDETAKYPNGILAVRVGGAELQESFAELHPTCRVWDVARRFWLVPVPLLGDILERYPQAKVYGLLNYLLAWTAAIPFEKKLEITDRGSTKLPAIPEHIAKRMAEKEAKKKLVKPPQVK
jgi:hypothetical protein